MSKPSDLEPSSPTPGVGARQPTRSPALPRTPLALPVLNLLVERPMHPYEMKQLMRARGHERAVRLKDASLYDMVERLARLGFIAATEVSRSGRRPERTVYAITETGRDELQAWMTDLVSQPAHEYPRLAAALMFIYALGKDGAIGALSQRAALLDADIARIDAYQMAIRPEVDAWFREATGGKGDRFPRLFGIEEEYAQAMRRAELSWVRATLEELLDGRLAWPDPPNPTEIDRSNVQTSVEPAK